jgi:hypothetical protein
MHRIAPRPRAAQEITLDNDRVFAAYVVILFPGFASLITASIVTGIASVPSPVSFLEHLALSLGFRAAYKSLNGGFSWDDWSITRGRASAAATELELVGEPSVA